MQPNPEAVVQQLYLVSLALEQAIVTENWAETNSLFESRAALIEKLSHVKIAGRAKEIMLLVQQHEAKLIQIVTDAKRSASDEVAAFALAQKATQAYLAA
jgi:hypothetical protein